MPSLHRDGPLNERRAGRLPALQTGLDRRFLQVGELGDEDPKVRRAALESQFEAIISPEHSQWREMVTEAKKKS